MSKDLTLALLTINKLGGFDKRTTKKIAAWLRDIAEKVENSHKEYPTTGPVRFRYFAPAPKE